jgi:transposase
MVIRKGDIMKWLTVKEVAEMLNCSVKTVRRRLKKGEWESKEEQIGAGKPTIMIKVDTTPPAKAATPPQRGIEEGDKSELSKLDTSEDISSKNCISKLDTSENISSYNASPKLDILPKKEQIGQDLAEPGLPKVSKLDKSKLDNRPKELLNNDITKLDNSNSKLSKLDTPQKQVSKLDTSKLDTSKLDSLKLDSYQNSTTLENRPIPSELDPLRWIPLDRAVGLSGLSERTLYRRIESKDLYSIVVADKLSKQKALIDVSGFSNEVQARWKAEVMASNRDLSTLLVQEKKEFELHVDEDKNRAWARKSIIEEYYKYRKMAKANGTSLTTACKQFEIKLNNHELLPGILKRLSAISVSIKTIKKWEKSWRDSGNNTYPVSLLEQKRGKVGRKKVVSSSLEKEIESYAVSYKDFPATEIYRVLSDQLAMMGEEMPISVRTLTNLVNKIRKDKAAVAVSKGKKWEKDNLKVHVKRINNALPGQIWESDGHKLNNLVYSPFYAHKAEFKYLVRPQLMAWYDVGTGFILDGTLTLSENRNVVRTSLRYAMLKGGLPDEIRLDNGPAYKNADFVPLAYAGKKRLTPAVKRAKEMLSKGDKGLYANLGIKCAFTIPGNPESKSIEPFWNFCISMFEKIFDVWIGNNIQNRPEILKLTNAVLMKRYGNYIPTWEQYDELLQRFILLWNNRKRDCLVNGRGETLTPQEAYSQVEHKCLSIEELERITKFAYPNPYMVSRGRINVNGILYWHPSFRALDGKYVNAYYDEKNIKEVTIGTEFGEIFQQPAMIVYPGLQVGDDMGAYIEARHQEKIMKSVYAAIHEAGSDVQRNRMMLEASSDTIFIQDKKQDKIKQGNKMLMPSPNSNSDHKIKLIPENEITITEDDIAKVKQDIFEDDVNSEEIENEKIKSIMDKINNNQQEEKEDNEIEEILRRIGAN